MEMTIRTISGNEIDAALTAAMQATIAALVEDGLLDAGVGESFSSSHFCTVVDESRVWRMIRKTLGLGDKEQRVVVFRAVAKRAG